MLDEPGREVPGGEHTLLAHVHQERKRSPLAVDRFDRAECPVLHADEVAVAPADDAVAAAKIPLSDEKALAPEPALPGEVTPLLSPEEVAQQCGLSRKSVYRAIERGELAAFRLCSRLRVRPEDVEAWLATNVVAPADNRASSDRAPRPLGSGRLPAPGGLRNLLPSS